MNKNTKEPRRPIEDNGPYEIGVYFRVWSSMPDKEIESILKGLGKNIRETFKRWKKQQETSAPNMKIKKVYWYSDV